MPVFYNVRYWHKADIRAYIKISSIKVKLALSAVKNGHGTGYYPWHRLSVYGVKERIENDCCANCIYIKRIN